GFRPNVFSALLATNRRAGTHGIAEKMMSRLPFLAKILLLVVVPACCAGVARAQLGPAATSGVFLRGANTNQTLVLIDGQRVGSSTSGTAALEAIPLDAIDHIEI